MHDVPELLEGYRTFLRDDYQREASLYRSLADDGQSPRTMVIACCDSRVDPSRIFSARPGQIFIVRNVANLVPPFEPLGDYHGTSAAIEFAVTSLEVATIVVLGHGQCGGIHSFIDDTLKPPTPSSFITKWISLLRPAWGEVVARHPDASIEVRQTALEKASIRYSIANLETFPFVKQRLAAGTLKLRGGFFDIWSGKLQTLDSATGEFAPVD